MLLPLLILGFYCRGVFALLLSKEKQFDARNSLKSKKCLKESTLFWVQLWVPYSPCRSGGQLFGRPDWRFQFMVLRSMEPKEEKEISFWGHRSRQDFRRKQLYLGWRKPTKNHPSKTIKKPAHLSESNNVYIWLINNQIKSIIIKVFFF